MRRLALRAAIRRGTLALLLWAVSAAAVPTAPAAAQAGGEEGDEARVLETARAALEAISGEDMVALTDLMIPEAVMYPTGLRDGRKSYELRTRTEQRMRKPERDLVERGFDAEVQVQGPLAVVWMPYDLYVDGEWSHCGVDAFTLLNVEGTWRIAVIAWSVEQPPDCRKHPDGPPEGLAGGGSASRPSPAAPSRAETRSGRRHGGEVPAGAAPPGAENRESDRAHN